MHKSRDGEPAKTGRPAYDKKVLLKLCLYGCVNDIRSSRQLARESLVNGEVQWSFEPAADIKILEVGLKANTLSYEERSARVKTLKGRMDVYPASLSDGGSKKKTAASNLLSGMSEEDVAAKAVEAKEMIAFYEGVYEDCPKKLKKH